jgi:hypothetical protein
MWDDSKNKKIQLFNMTDMEKTALQTLAKMMADEKKRFLSSGNLPEFFYNRAKGIPPKTLSMKLINEFGSQYNLRYDPVSNGIILTVKFFFVLNPSC